MRGLWRGTALGVQRHPVLVDVVWRRASQQPRQLPEADAKTHAWSDASPHVSKSNSTAIAVSFAAPHGVSDAEADSDSYAAADARAQQATDAATDARAQRAPDAPTDIDADAAADARAQQAPNAATDAGTR